MIDVMMNDRVVLMSASRRLRATPGDRGAFTAARSGDQRHDAALYGPGAGPDRHCDGECDSGPARARLRHDPSGGASLKNRQQLTNTDTPLWVGAIHEGQISGVRAIATKQIPAATMIYGDWSHAAVAEWGVLSVEVDPFADFKAGMVGVRGLYALDVLVLHPEAFTVVFVDYVGETEYVGS